MGVIDWIIVIFLLVFIVIGIRRGLAGALIQLAGFILSFFLVGHYYPLLANQLMLKYGIMKLWATIFAVIMILILITVVIRFVTWAINRFIKSLRLSNLNRFLGALFGLLNGLLLVIIFSIVMDYMPNLSTPLKDGRKHRVYAAVDVLKNDLFDTLKLQSRLKYIDMSAKQKPKE
ncbi:MAG: CvpA family protein [Candidatus Cloacimonetes bacterium]|nr:CvpA family protein [Candidatus Cloacimonadota bacterium]